MKRNKLLVAIAIGSITFFQPTFGQTSESIEQLVNSAKILPTEYKIRASVKGPEATIITYRNAKAIDQDCKIDAILIAQKVMEAYKSIAAVRTQFLYINKPSQYDQVEIHAGDVKAFDSGGLTKQRLLDSLPITKGGAGKQTAIVDDTKFKLMVKNYKVVQGFEPKIRQNTLECLQKIQLMGADARPLWDEFQSLENKVKAGLTGELTGECNNLYTKAYAAYLAADKQGTKQILAKQAELNAMTSQKALSNQPVYGPMYPQRMRLAQRIQTLARAGENVQWYQAMFFNYIEKYARTNDVAHLKPAISELEMKMGLAPMQ
ncbi:MAG: hypothetical protein JST89_15120 [Cyanobacteria bacterium SZAS-4]|nr:hypothetical protein [Cyanobacteria bacterium SZAS-4]